MEEIEYHCSKCLERVSVTGEDQFGSFHCDGYPSPYMTEHDPEED